MIYYNENGEIIQEADIDLDHGYLEDRDIIHHDYVPAVQHQEKALLPNGEVITYTVTDVPAKPAYDEVISQTFYYTGATDMEKLEGQVMFTAVMTDTLLETEEGI